MTRFWGIVRYEYGMAMRRIVGWIGFLLAGGQMLALWLGAIGRDPQVTPLQWAGMLGLLLNGLMPVVAGIVIADRLARDRQMGVRELFFSTPLTRRTYVLGKYVGALLSVLTQALLVMIIAAGVCLYRGVPLGFLGPALLAFVAIDVPAYIFVAAFSLACPELMPVRVYQILFVGYWFWGNFLTPKMVPTLNGTLLTVKGDFVASALFHADKLMPIARHTLTEAALNLLILTALAALALLALERLILRRQAV